jgi:octaprenyl-diphosphate synthase
VTSVRSLYGPIAEDLELVEDALHLVTRSDFLPLQNMLELVLQRAGKRLRPAMALLAGGFGEYETDNQVALAASIELLHTATLVHDDVIDTAETRRGLPTANSQYDNAASVMLGDYMFAHAAELVARTGNIDVIRLFAETLMTMAKGELDQDISAFDATSGTMRDYYRRIFGKTASLFATAGAGGAMMSACDRETTDALRSFGRHLGMAFQIVDDVLDFCGTAEALGKPVGSDLSGGTLTLPSILLMEDDPTGNPVSRLFETDDPALRDTCLAEALDLVCNGDVADRSMAVAQDWRDQALAAIADLPRNAHREALEGIADFVTQRDF